MTSHFANDGVRTISINSTDIVEGQLVGKFKLTEMLKLFQNSAGSVYTNYKPYEISPAQSLDFDFKVYDKIVEIFYPDVEVSSNTFLKGKIDADTDEFLLTFNSPSIKVKEKVN